MADRVALSFDSLPDLHLEFSGISWLDRDEPNYYCVEYHCKILVGDPRGDGEEPDLEVGTVEVIHARFGEAVNNGVSWIDVLDAHSAGVARYCELIQDSCEWKEDLEVVGNLDLLILDHCVIQLEYRGYGFGLLAAKCAIDTFANSCGVVAAIPFPLDFSGFDDPSWVPPPGVTHENKEQAFGKAKAKLVAYWSRLGLEPYGEEILVALTAHHSPSAEEIFQELHRPLPSRPKPPGRARHRHGVRGLSRLG